jgi:hypothetical protein
MREMGKQFHNIGLILAAYERTRKTVCLRRKLKWCARAYCTLRNGALVALVRDHIHMYLDSKLMVAW